MGSKVGKGVVNRMIAYAFTVGVLVALVLGLISPLVPASVAPYLISLLVLAGIAVGFFNIHPDEVERYVLYVTAIVIVTSMSKGSLGEVQIIGRFLESILASIMAFIVPSVVVVGLKAVLGLARN